jgi:hypothetical protein
VSSATTFYVNNKTGLDSYNGLSPTVGGTGVGPKLTIAGAIVSAVNGDTITVASTGISYSELNTDGKSLIFNSSGGVAIITTMMINNPTKFIGPYALDSTGTMTLNSSLTIANNMTMYSGCTIRRRQAGSITLDRTGADTTNVGTLTFGNNMNVVYESSGAGSASFALLGGGGTIFVPLAADIVSGIELPSIVNNLTISRSANVANAAVLINTSVTVNGNLSIYNNLATTPLGATFTTPATISVTGNVTIAANDPSTTYTAGTAPVMAFGSSVSFVGTTDQTITVPAGGSSVGSITVNKPTGSLIISGGDLTCSGVVTFISGLVKTGATNALVLTRVANSAAQGFLRAVATGSSSHVFGNVRQNLLMSNVIAFAAHDFPVGDAVNYRPASLTFFNANVGGTISLGVNATVSHTNTRPTGTVGLPIIGGIDATTDLARYPGFFWSIKTDGPVGNTAFDLGLTAAGFNPNEISLNDVGMNRVKIIQRNGTANDVNNKWTLQGNSYDNNIFGGVPTVVTVNTTGGLSTTGSIFTYGFAYIIPCVECPYILTLYIGDPPYKTTFKNVFGGNTGSLTYSAKSSDTTIAAALIVGDTLIITPVSVGHTTISVTALDVDGSSITFYAYVTVALRWTNTVSGTVTYGSTTNPVGGVKVTLTPATGTGLWGTSSAVGNYLIIVASGKTYQLTATKTGNWGGVTGGDALLVARHATGIAMLTGLPLQAADVNNSGSVTGADALLIVRRAAGLDTSFAAGDWVFTSKQVTVSSADTTVNIPGLCVGDVNASYTPSSGSALSKDNILIPIQFGLPKEEPVTIEIYNALGEKKRTLIRNLMMSAGCNQIFWDGNDDAGISITKGVYHYLIKAGNIQMIKQVLVVK